VNFLSPLENEEQQAESHAKIAKIAKKRRRIRYRVLVPPLAHLFAIFTSFA
jgi:hypothetical protein